MLSADGFGITYLAHDAVLQKDVVFKEYFPSDLARRAPNGVITPVSDDTKANFEKGLAQFLVEARTLARFVHPNIVRVDRHFEANGTAYMLREYKKGNPSHSNLLARPNPTKRRSRRYCDRCSTVWRLSTKPAFCTVTSSPGTSSGGTMAHPVPARFRSRSARQPRRDAGHHLHSDTGIRAVGAIRTQRPAGALVGYLLPWRPCSTGR